MVSVATDDFIRLNQPTPAARTSMQNFKDELDSKWPMTHEDEVTEILGVKIVRMESGALQATQPTELAKIETLFFPNGSVPEVLIPLYPSIQPDGNELEDPEHLSTPSSDYRSLLGSLQYMRCTRIDILDTLSILAERTNAPRLRDKHALYWLAAYLLTSRLVPISFHPVNEEEGGVTANGVLQWSLFSDCSWATRRKSFSSVGHMIVAGTLDTSIKRTTRPFTAPTLVKMRKEKGPPSDSASAGELGSSVSVIKAGTVLRGMSEELAGIPSSLIRMPVGHGGASPLLVQPASPLLTDNASNVKALDSNTSKKPKGLRHWSRELNFARFHIEEGSIQLVAIPATEQRANPLTKPLRAYKQHWFECEWLQGTSVQLTSFQELAVRRSQSKHSHRHAVSVIMHHVGDLTNEVDDGDRFAFLLSAIVFKDASFDSDEQLLYFHTWSNAHESVSTASLRLKLQEEREERVKQKKFHRSLVRFS